MNRKKTKNRLNPTAIPRELLERHSTSGPRYTSYPTAPQFSEAFEKDNILAEWKRKRAEHRRGLSLYIHIPFCQTLCLFCGCYTQFKQAEMTVNDYVRAILHEADRILKVIHPDRKVEQMALGGGTPTHLSMNQMRDLMTGLKERFDFPPSGERSLEIDPLTVNEEYLDLLIELGFNRYSFGVQDLDPVVQKNVNRVMPSEVLVRLLDHLRKRGKDAINLDLIYGLPGQTVISFGKTIRKILSLRPSRIALFGYAHVPWIRPHQKALEQYHLPDPEERLTLFGTAYEMLLDAGYAAVGMDHFALPEDELILALNDRTLTRNFMGYTTRRGLDLVGLGASAISSVGITYTQNVKDIGDYIKRAERLPWNKGMILTPEDEIRRDIILDLFCNFHLDISAVEKKFDIDFISHFATELTMLRPMEGTGLIAIEDNTLGVTEMGRFFIRNICMCFDQYLTGANPEIRYSRTI